MTLHPVAANALNHLFLLLVLMAHVLTYLPLKPGRIRAAFWCLPTLLPMPLFHLLTGQKTPLYSLPLYLPLYALFCAAIYRAFIVQAGFRAVIFTIATAMAHMQLFFTLIYALMTQALGFPTDEATHLTARKIYGAFTLLSLPFLRIYVRPHFLKLLEAVERQRIWLIILLSCALFMAGNAMISVLLSRSDPVALRNCLTVAFCIVVFYCALYNFIIRENVYLRLENQVEAAERLAGTYKFYDAELREKEQAVRALRHDFRHMLLHLETLLKDKDYDGVARHIAGLSDRVMEMRPVAYCENMTVNTLTAYHFARALAAGIACSAALYVPEKLALPPADLAVIIGNALENAQKGAESLGEAGYIRFEAKPVKDCLVFNLENNYRPGGYRQGAGVGLSSIRELAAKHQGRAKTDDADGVFTLNIVLRLEG